MLSVSRNVANAHATDHAPRGVMFGEATSPPSARVDFVEGLVEGGVLRGPQLAGAGDDILGFFGRSRCASQDCPPGSIS
jgi:hypothetical protein